MVGSQLDCPSCGEALSIPTPEAVNGPPGAIVQSTAVVQSGAVVPPGTSGAAIASLVLGILSFGLFFLAGIPAVILGMIGLHKVDRNHGQLRGHGLATTGIVMGSIGILLSLLLPALLLPAVQAAREAARRNTSINNMKQIGLAIHNHYDAYQNFPTSAITDANGKPLLSWRVKILPFIEQTELYNEFHLDEPWDSDHNIRLIERIPAVYRRPGGPVGKTSHLAVAGPGTMFPGGAEPILPESIRDGVSNTIMVVEVDDGETAIWTKPDDWQFDPLIPTRGLGSLRPGGFLALFADGHMQFIKDDVDPQSLSALFNPADGTRTARAFPP